MSQAEELFDDLLTVRPYRSSEKLTQLEKWFQRASRYSLLAALVGLGIVLLFGLGKFLTGPLPPWAVTIGLAVGLLDVLAWYGMLISDAVATFLQVVHRKVRDHHSRGSFKHDMAIAARLATYPKPAVAQADAWFEDESGTIDRRISLFVGKELAIVGLGFTLLTGKANEAYAGLVAFLAPTFRTSPTHVTEALILAFFLMIMGAFGIKARVARYAYVRYLIRLSASIREEREGDGSETPVAASAPPEQPPVSGAAVALSDHRRDVIPAAAPGQAQATI
ncbi:MULTISPECIES: hypothetical protein [unclassified Luteibacter]|uniref:hypothetical protein n=1 Tax=Luteibacter sp. PvP019 TaxID=3156436 RepID=UPI003395AEFB